MSYTRDSPKGSELYLIYHGYITDISDVRTCVRRLTSRVSYWPVTYGGVGYGSDSVRLWDGGVRSSGAGSCPQVVHRVWIRCGYVVDCFVDNVWKTKIIGVSRVAGVVACQKILGPEKCLNSPRI